MDQTTYYWFLTETSSWNPSFSVKSEDNSIFCSSLLFPLPLLWPLKDHDCGASVGVKDRLKTEESHQRLQTVTGFCVSRHKKRKCWHLFYSLKWGLCWRWVGGGPVVSIKLPVRLNWGQKTSGWMTPSGCVAFKTCKPPELWS